MKMQKPTARRMSSDAYRDVPGSVIFRLGHTTDKESFLSHIDYVSFISFISLKMIVTITEKSTGSHFRKPFAPAGIYLQKEEFAIFITCTRDLSYEKGQGCAEKILKSY